MTNSVVFDLDSEGVAFLRDRLAVDYSNGADLACQIRRDGHLVFVVVCEFKTAFDAHLTVACDDPTVVTRRVLRAVFRALFSRAKRVTALIEPGNRRCISLARRLGFKDEGFGRLMIEGKRDALIFGMLESDCAVFKGSQHDVSRETKVQHGIEPKTPGSGQDSERAGRG